MKPVLAVKPLFPCRSHCYNHHRNNNIGDSFFELDYRFDCRVDYRCDHHRISQRYPLTEMAYSYRHPYHSAMIPLQTHYALVQTSIV